MIQTARRTFAAVVEPAGVSLVEYRLERDGFRIVGQTSDIRHFDGAAEAFAALNQLLVRQEFRRASVSIAMHQFGSFHHMMTLPTADDRVIGPVIRREVQRTLDITDPVIAFVALGEPVERRGPDRADALTAPRRYFAVGIPRDTSDALVRELRAPNLDVRCVTLVCEAIRRVYKASHDDTEPTAVVACLAGGAHVDFFVNGRMELALDPPMGLEIDRHVERGAAYLRQQFRDAELQLLLLAAPAAEQESLAEMLGNRLAVRVEPLMPRTGSPEAIVAMGAVLAADAIRPLDLYPHPPTTTQRARESLRGAQGVATGLSVAAAVVAFWAVLQLTSFRRTERDVQAMREQIDRGIPAVAPLKQLAQRRARYVERLSIANDVRAERDRFTTQLAALASIVPPSVRLDSMVVTRLQAGWATTIGGQVTSPSTAESVRAVNQFYQALQARPGVATPSLDQFDYPAAPPSDSMSHADRGVSIQFRISFTSPVSGESR